MENSTNKIYDCNSKPNVYCDTQENICNCKSKGLDCEEQCIDESSIFFSGLCTGSDFDLSEGLWTELSINGEIAVPEEKPLIEEIDSINAKIEIINRKVIETPGITGEVIKNLEGRNATGRKLIIEGLICLTTNYVSTNIDQSVHSFHGAIPFSAFIVLPQEINNEDPLNMNFLVSYCIEEVTVKYICGRHVNLTTAFVLSASQSVSSCTKSYFLDSGIDCNTNKSLGVECPSCETSQTPVIAGVCNVERIRNILVTGSTSNDLWTEISVPEVLNIPCVKPDIDQILSVNSTIKVMCQKVIATPYVESTGTPPVQGTNLENLTLTGRKLIVEALLHQRVTYVSKTDCQSVHSAHFDMPVSAYIMVPETTLLTDKFKIFTCIEDIYACVLNDRQIFKNTTLFIKAQPIKCPLN